MASETTAAATGAVGVVRRDPMAMKPFCGYNFADYWDHWLSFSERAGNLPKIFHVNWFRKDEDGNFLWPGFGENLRVLQWMIARCKGEVDAVETPIGYLPHREDIRTEGLSINGSTMDELLRVDHGAWRKELEEIGAFLEGFGDRLPAALRAKHREVARELG